MTGKWPRLPSKMQIDQNLTWRKTNAEDLAGENRLGYLKSS